MLAVVLAAGRGTRMGALTAATPKPMLRLRGRPILEHILRGLGGAGVRTVVIVTGYLGEQIEEYFGDGDKVGLGIVYRHQGNAEGTARALLLAGDVAGDEDVVVSWGDVVIQPDEYRALIDDFCRTPCDALLSLNRTDDPWRGAAVYVDDRWQVTRLIEKPPRGTSTTTWNNAGVFVASSLLFEYAERLQPSARNEYELPQAIAAMVSDGRVVRGHPLRGFWSDLGTAQDLAEAEEHYRDRS
ncbi:MAG TPA: nucleotidyltransferase family protein [Candidatus Acidoferrales bacterium]|nr:nucleotidyltransferase family protein [Candidatus Acidoferrales bacterium]